jgi:putative transcriptional regulator
VRDIGVEILEGTRAIKRGEGRRFRVEVPPIVATRQKTGISQSQFAERLGVSVRSLKEKSK